MSSRTALAALARAAWQEQWNRLWLYSPWKAGFWLAVGHAPFAAAMFRVVLGRSGTDWTPGSLLLMLGLQAGIGSLLGAFARGREQLYGHRFLPFLHASPAPPEAVIVAQVLGEWSRRACSALGIGVGLATLLPAATWVWSIPGFWGAAMLTGVLGQLTGLLALVAWIRVSPRSFGAIAAGSILLQAGMVGYIVFVIASHPQAPALEALVGPLRLWVAIGLALVIGLPGAAMAFWLLLAPQSVGSAYRHGWLLVVETASMTRQRRSHWPAMVGGPAGSIQAKDWLVVARNPLTRLRMLILGAGWSALLLGRLWPRGVDVQRASLLTLVLGVGLTLLVTGEVVATLFHLDGPGTAIYILSDTGSARLLLGKLMAASPQVLLAAASVAAGSVLSGLPVAAGLRLSLIAALISAGATVIMVAGAALDTSPAPVASTADSAALEALFEQVPQGPGAWAGLLSGMLYAVAECYLLVGGWAIGPGVVVLPAVPLMALAAGYVRLLHLAG